MKRKTKSISLPLKFPYFILPPVLTAIFPILSFYSKNISELSLKFLGKPLLYSIAATTVATLFASALIKNKNKASLIVFLLAFIFFSYGHLSQALNSKLFIQLPRGIVLGPDKILLPTTALLSIFLIIKTLRSKKTLAQIISFISVSLLIIVGYLTCTIIKNEYKKKGNSSTTTISLQNKTSVSQETMPDIYYIILDGYARQDILKSIYHYDNSWFVNSLRKMGFYVADAARPNYIHTYISLPSTLNMRYLDDLPQKYGINPVSNIAARQLIYDNEVTRKLRTYGYTIINFASTWEGTNESYQADVTYKSDEYFKVLGRNIALDETTIVFLQTTLLSPFIKEVWFDAIRARTLATLQKLPTVPLLKGKKFTIAHIIPPHPPYVFTAEGNPAPGTELEFSRESTDKYIDQLIFISNQILPVLQKIIKNSPNPPIIILQSDHGPSSLFGRSNEWSKNYSEEGIKERSSILYAVYLPDKNYRQFYDSITPVNSFRIVFNKYFEEDFPLLPDKTFYTDFEKLYEFKDITSIK